MDSCQVSRLLWIFSRMNVRNPWIWRDTTWWLNTRLSHTFKRKPNALWGPFLGITEHKNSFGLIKIPINNKSTKRIVWWYLKSHLYWLWSSFLKLPIICKKFYTQIPYIAKMYRTLRHLMKMNFPLDLNMRKIILDTLHKERPFLR